MSVHLLDKVLAMFDKGTWDLILAISLALFGIVFSCACLCCLCHMNNEPTNLVDVDFESYECEAYECEEYDCEPADCGAVDCEEYDCGAYEC